MTGDASDGAVGAAEALEVAVDDAIAVCDGDPRAAVRALLVALDAMDRDIAALEAEVAEIRAATLVSDMRDDPRRQNCS